MNRVETQSRRLLGWYPSAWRAANEDALVGTILDSAEAEGRTHLSASLQWDLIVAGLGEHFSAVISREARDLAAAIALGVGSGLALVQLVTVEWDPWIGTLWQDLKSHQNFAPFGTSAAAVYVLWLLAFAFGILRMHGPMRVALVLSIAWSISIFLGPDTPASFVGPTTTSLLISGVVALTACLANAFSRRFRLHAVIAMALTIITSALLVWLQWPSWSFIGSRMFLDAFKPWALGLAMFIVLVVFVLAGRRTFADAVLFGVGPALTVLFTGNLWSQRGSLALIVLVGAGCMILLILRKLPIRVRVEKVI